MLCRTDYDFGLMGSGSGHGCTREHSVQLQCWREGVASRELRISRQDDANTVLVKNLLTGEGVLATVATRIAGDPTLKGPARITFDEVNDNHILEAFWPARDDGYLVQVTAVKHKHRINQSGIAL